MEDGEPGARRVVVERVEWLSIEEAALQGAVIVGKAAITEEDVDDVGGTITENAGLLVEVPSVGEFGVWQREGRALFSLAPAVPRATSEDL